MYKDTVQLIYFFIMAVVFIIGGLAILFYLKQNSPFLEQILLVSVFLISTSLAFFFSLIAFQFYEYQPPKNKNSLETFYDEISKYLPIFLSFFAVIYFILSLIYFALVYLTNSLIN